MEHPTENPEFEALVRKYGHPLRVFAESCILRVIDELKGDAAIRYQEFNRVCYANGEGIDDFESFASVTVSQIEGIRQLWNVERRKDTALRPVDFARQYAHDIFGPNVDVPEV